MENFFANVFVPQDRLPQFTHVHLFTVCVSKVLHVFNCFSFNADKHQTTNNRPKK